MGVGVEVVVFLEECDAAEKNVSDSGFLHPAGNPPPPPPPPPLPLSSCLNAVRVYVGLSQVTVYFFALTQLNMWNQILEYFN